MQEAQWARICLLYPPDIQASHLQHSTEIPELTTNRRAWALQQTRQQGSQQHRVVCPRPRAAAHLALHSLTPSYLKQLHLPLQAVPWIGFPPHQKLPPAFGSENIAIPNPGHSVPQTWAPPGISVPHPSPVPASSSCSAPLANAVSPPFPVPCS